jgi:hypothetical protein
MLTLTLLLSRKNIIKKRVNIYVYREEESQHSTFDKKGAEEHYFNPLVISDEIRRGSLLLSYLHLWLYLGQEQKCPAQSNTCPLVQASGRS